MSCSFYLCTHANKRGDREVASAVSPPETVVVGIGVAALAYLSQ